MAFSIEGMKKRGTRACCIEISIGDAKMLINNYAKLDPERPIVIEAEIYPATKDKPSRIVSNGTFSQHMFMDKSTDYQYKKSWMEILLNR